MADNKYYYYKLHYYYYTCSSVAVRKVCVILS